MRVGEDLPQGPIRYRIAASASATGIVEPDKLKAFQKWLDRQCYVFTINGFPYGDFHGTRVKEDVYRPVGRRGARGLHQSPLRLDMPDCSEGMEASVSTVPGSFKRFIDSEEQLDAMR